VVGSYRLDPAYPALAGRGTFRPNAADDLCSLRFSPIPFGATGNLRGFPGMNLPRDTVFFSEKYSICSIYFKCLSDKLGIERRLRILIRKIRNKATMGST
jgi:hypothetical protein